MMGKPACRPNFWAAASDTFDVRAVAGVDADLVASVDDQRHLGTAATDLLVLVRHDLHDLAVVVHRVPTLEFAGRNHLIRLLQRRAFGELHSTRAPSSSRTIRSSMRTPPQPGR